MCFYRSGGQNVVLEWDMARSPVLEEPMSMCETKSSPRALAGASRTPQWGSCRLSCGAHFLTRQAARQQTDPPTGKLLANTVNFNRAERD